MQALIDKCATCLGNGGVLGHTDVLGLGGGGGGGGGSAICALCPRALNKPLAGNEVLICC